MKVTSSGGPEATSAEAKKLAEKQRSLFTKLSSFANKTLSELNLTKVKAAVLKHDSKLCQ